MAKDPAFMFYPGDWALGTMHLNFLEKGAYFDLLILQFSRGKFNINDVKCLLKDHFDSIWPRIVDKFKTDGILFWNERLEYEIVKRKKFSEHQSNNVKKRWDKNTDDIPPDIPNSYQTDTKTIPLENENINENDIDISIEFINRTTQKTLKKSEVENYWKAFKIHSTESYKKRSEIITHFRNWLKKEIQNGTNFKVITGAKLNTSDKKSEAYAGWGRNFSG